MPTGHRAEDGKRGVCAETGSKVVRGDQMKRLLIPFSIAILVGAGVIWSLGERDPRSHDRWSGGRSSEPTGREESPPISDLDQYLADRSELPVNDLLVDPRDIEEVPPEDDSMQLSLLPGSSWQEIENWFRDQATLEERLQTCEEILSALPRDKGLDRILLLTELVAEDAERTDYCRELAKQLTPTVLASSEECARFRQILTRGNHLATRTLALHLTYAAIAANRSTHGVMEACEIAFYQVIDGQFAIDVFREIGGLQSPTRAIRMVGEAQERAKELPESRYFEAAVLGADSILNAEKQARARIRSGAELPGSTLRREYQMVDQLGLRDQLIAGVYSGALDGKRTPEELEAVIVFLRKYASHLLARFRRECSQPEVRELLGS